MNIYLNRIESVNDRHLIPALKIYQESFPVYEQMSTVFWFDTVLSLPQPDTYFYAVTEAETQDTVGMVFYRSLLQERDIVAKPVAFLWYICIRGDQRGNGLGGLVYQQLTQSLFESGYAAMVFEVEKPEEAQRHGDESAEVARRRIGWYRRNGARILHGVNYFQTVDNGTPPTPMHIMIHTPESVTPNEAYDLACLALEEDLEKVADLALL